MENPPLAFFLVEVPVGLPVEPVAVGVFVEVTVESVALRVAEVVRLMVAEEEGVVVTVERVGVLVSSQNSPCRNEGHTHSKPA